MTTQEINQRLVEQDRPGLRRRQFQGEKMELAVWQNADGDVVHFRVLLFPDILVYFEHGVGLATAHGEFPRLKRRYFLTPEVEGEAPLDLPDIISAVPDERVEFHSVRFAFERLVDNPPTRAKRVLSFVAHVLYEVLTSPQGVLKFMEGKLPQGDDSVYADPSMSQQVREAGQRRLQFRAAFNKLLSMLRDSDD